MENALSKDAAEFLYTGDYAYFCFDRELIEPLDKMVEDGSFQQRLEEFLLDNIDMGDE